MYYEEHRCKEHEEDADAVARYGIADVVDSTGISAYTIRYYDKCGFFPDLARDHRGVRSFSQIDIAQLHFVDARASNTMCACRNVVHRLVLSVSKSCAHKKRCLNTSAPSSMKVSSGFMPQVWNCLQIKAPMNPPWYSYRSNWSKNPCFRRPRSRRRTKRGLRTALRALYLNHQVRRL